MVTLSFGAALGCGLAMMLIIEGVMPFVAPKLWRRLMEQAAQQTESRMRVLGAISMLGGLLLLAWMLG
jgi:uncharacterized protein YjeT (DUF2065 family)